MPPLPALSLALLALAAGAAPLPASAEGNAPRGEGAAAPAIAFDARAAEHLLSRAGFGARPEEIERAVERGLEATVAELLGGGRAVEPFFAQRLDPSQVLEMRGMDPEARRQAAAERRRADGRQMEEYRAWWLERMLAGDDPLRDRMTLFWHGFFTSSYADVRRSHEMIAQHRLLRDNAIESYAAMLRGIVRDAAMLRYLDNDRNQRLNPNENLARELLELFSLGEGNYTEQDVKGVARALTGYHVTPDGEFRFSRRAHDPRLKEVLGQRGRFDGDAVVEILLGHPACARHVAGRILEHLEGVAPDEPRREEYAKVLRAHDYALAPLLEKLFTDPRFYRDQVVGARVAGPVDFLVGMCRRLGLRPPPRLIPTASSVLGQALFEPPNVKGWEEGPAWITTASLLQRGNLAGLLLGTIEPVEGAGDRPPRLGPLARGAARRAGAPRPGPDPRGEEAELDEDVGDEEAAAPRGGSMEGSMEGGSAERRPGDPPGSRPVRSAAAPVLRALGTAWTPPIHLSWRMRRAGASSDLELARRMASDLLAIQPPADTVERLARYLAGERAARGIAEGALLEDEQASEEVLRRLAHLILSSPEAQLH